MNNPNNVFIKKNTEHFVVGGKVLKVIIKEKYANIIIAGPDGEINIMAFNTVASGGVGVDHKNLAIRINNHLADGKKVFLSAIVQREDFESVVTNKTVSTSFILLPETVEPQSFETKLNLSDKDVKFNDRCAENIFVMSGYVTAVFHDDGKNFLKLSFKDDKTGRYVQTRCFQKTGDSIDAATYAANIKNLKDAGKNVHAFVPVVKVSLKYDERDVVFYKTLNLFPYTERD